MLAGPHGVMSAPEVEVRELLPHAPHLLLRLRPQSNPQPVVGAGVGSDGGDVDGVLGNLRQVEVNLYEDEEGGREMGVSVYVCLWAMLQALPY